MTLHQQPLITIYDTLSLTNSTLLSPYNILWCTKNPVPSWWFSFLIQQEKIIPCSYGALWSHPTPCTSTKSNLYLDNSLPTAVNDPDLYKLIPLHVPDHTFIFPCLDRTKGSVHTWANYNRSVRRPVFTVRIVSTSPKPKTGEQPLVGSPRLLAQYRVIH